MREKEREGKKERKREREREGGKEREKEREGYCVGKIENKQPFIDHDVGKERMIDRWQYCLHHRCAYQEQEKVDKKPRRVKKKENHNQTKKNPTGSNCTS